MSAFFPAQGWFNQIGEKNVEIYHCVFAKEHYQDGLFAQFDVPYSASLERAVIKRKAEYLAGRYCAKVTLAQYGIHAFTVLPDKNRCPQWPQGLKGAITHSDHQALVAITNDLNVLGIGIDIEAIMSDKTMNDVSSMIVKGNENHLVNATHTNLPPQFAAVSANLVTSLIFSIKESFFKAGYPSTGHYFDFDAVTVNQIDFNTHRFTLTVNQNLNPKLTPGMQFSGQFAIVDGQVLSLLVL